MSSNKPQSVQEFYEQCAQEYSRTLSGVAFGKSTGQATQREITLESLALVKSKRPDFKVFSDLLVLYPVKGRKNPEQVIPDNMVVLTTEPIHNPENYNTSLEPSLPLFVIEYESETDPRKDYEDSFHRYERDLKIPYCLMFNPETQDLSLYRHNKRGYSTVKPNEHGRYAIKEIDIEVGLVEGWVRYWYKGGLLPLPADLQQKLEEARRQAEEARQQAQAERQRAEQEKRRADLLQQRLAEMERELAALRDKSGKK